MCGKKGHKNEHCPHKIRKIENEKGSRVTAIPMVSKGIKFLIIGLKKENVIVLIQAMHLGTKKKMKQKNKPITCRFN